MRRGIWFGVSLLLVACLVSPVLDAQGDVPRAGGTLRIAITADPPSLDVQTQTSLLAYNRARELYNTLLRFSQDGSELEPELLAAMPQVSPDGLTYTFELRRGILTHQGDELTAEDVAFTFERLLKPETGSPNTWLLEDVKGAGAMVDGDADHLAGFEVLDAYRFRITLSEPYAPFLSLLAVPSASIYPEAAVRAAGERWGTEPVGTGPFKLAGWERGRRLVLQRHDGYFEEGLPYLDGIEISIIPEESTVTLEFEAGRFDYMSLSDADYERFRNDPQWQDLILSQSSLNTYYLMLNLDHPDFPALQDRRVREAIARAIDKQALVEYVLLGRATAASNFLSPGIPGYIDLPEYPYDPEGARRLLAEAGYGGGLSVEIWQTQSETTLSRNQAIQAMLREVGIDARIIQTDNAAYYETRNQGRIPVNHGNWWADYPDPDNYFYVFFHSSQSRRYSSNYRNPQVDAWLEEARRISDPAQRADLYQKVARQVVYDDIAVVPLWHLNDYAIRQPWVHGLYLHPSGVNHAHKTIWLER